MNTGRGRWLISLCLHSNLPAEARYVGLFDISSTVPALDPLLVSIFTLWLSIVQDFWFLYSTVDKIFVLHAFDLHALYHDTDLVLVIKTKAKIGQNQGVLVLVLINQNNIGLRQRQLVRQVSLNKVSSLICVTMVL